MTSNRLLSAAAALCVGLLMSTVALADSIQPLGTGTFTELKAGFEGKPFVVSLWSVDCLPCRVELELLGELKKQDPEFPLLLISTDAIEKREEAVYILEEYLAPLPSRRSVSKKFIKMQYFRCF